MRPARGTETILVVEDDPSVRRVAQETLEAQGYRVLVAADGPEALKLVEDVQQRVDLVLTDVVMPKMSGPELAAELQQRRPSIRVLLSSGYGGDLVDQATSPYAFLQKPMTPNALAAKVRELLDAPP